MKKEIYTIFGHTGFIGSNLKRKLKNKKLILPKRNQLYFKKNLGNIIYCIGSDNWQNEKYNSYHANLGNIPEIISKNKFESFTFLSTTRIYRNNKNTNEEVAISIKPMEQDHYYNIKKICAESFINICNKNFKIIRLSNVFGNNYKSPLVLPSMIRDAILKKKIFIMINKNSSKDFIDLDTACNIILKIIKYGKKKLYNVATEKNISLNQIAKKIKNITNCKIIYKNQKKKIIEPVININLIKREFNIKPKSIIIDQIPNLVRDFKDYFNVN